MIPDEKPTGQAVPVAGAVEDIELGTNEERMPVIGMPGKMDPNIQEVGVIPEILPPDVAAMQAYQPQFDLKYKPQDIEPSAADTDLMNKFAIFATPVMLDPNNPDSPYNDLAGSCYGVDVQRFTPVTQTDPGVYEGSIVDDKRHGIGRCTWADGSEYEGDWTQNRRHGKGTFRTCEGTMYEGNWVNDVKHGQGRLTYADGETICGTWQNDKINGIAKRKRIKGEATTVIFKNDMLIMNNDSGVSCCDITYAIFSVIFFLGFWGSIPLVIFVQPNWIGIMYVIVPYVIWSCCHPTTKYIKNLRTLEQTHENVQLAIKSEPTIDHIIQCYHYETRRDSKGRSWEERVNTHRAQNAFHGNWEDRSPPASTIDFLSVLRLTRLHTDKVYNYSPQASVRLHQQRANFIASNNHDTHYDYTLQQKIPHQTEWTLVFNEDGGKKPWYANYCLMIFLDCLLLGWLQRLVLNASAKVVEYKLVKYIY